MFPMRLPTLSPGPGSTRKGSPSKASAGPSRASTVESTARRKGASRVSTSDSGNVAVTRTLADSSPQTTIHLAKRTSPACWRT